MDKPKIQTMKELSKAISISRPTLARYFEDKTSVLPSTAKKIEAGLSEVDYVYNFIATRQNRKTTGLIGVVIPHFEDLFFVSLLDSIEVAMRDAGFTMITQSSHGDPALEAWAIQKLRSMNVDGAIVAPLDAVGSLETFGAAAEDFPIVFADSHPPDNSSAGDFVGTDNLSSVGIMVEYLCRTGNPPWFLAMPNLNSNAVERQNAYFYHMRKLGFEGRIIDTPDSPQTWEFERFGFEAMAEHFSHGRFVDDTILCANDRIAIGAIRAANTHGLFLRTAESRSELRIAGHDDHPLSRYIYPAVTTVAQDIEGIGRSAVDLLLDRVRDGGRDRSIKRLHDGSLKVRESA